MDKFLFANEASAKLAAPLSAGATSLTLDDASAFPTPGANQCFYATLFEPQSDGTQMRVEIVKVTARAGNTLTIARDVESITGQSGGYAYPSIPGAQAHCDLRLTAGTMKEMLQKADAQGFAAANHTHSKAAVGLGKVDNTSDADKPVSTAQAKAIGKKVDKTAIVRSGSSLNDVVQSGFYDLEDNITGGPASVNVDHGQMIVTGGDGASQIVFDARGDGFARSKTTAGGNFSAWKPLGGASSVPVGGYLYALDMPEQFTQDSATYLRAGSIVRYAPEYAGISDSLRVLGVLNETVFPGQSSKSSKVIYAQSGANTLSFAGGNVYKSADKKAWSSLGIDAAPNIRRPAVQNGVVAFPSSSNSNICVVNPTGATSNITMPSGKALSAIGVALNANYWLGISSINGSAGEIAYSQNSGATGGWTRVAGDSRMFMTQCNAIAHNGTQFVAVGSSSTPSAGRVVMSPTPHIPSSWVDATRYLSLGTNEYPQDIVFDGAHFMMLTNEGVYAGASGGDMKKISNPFDTSDMPFGNAGTNKFAMQNVSMATDGAGVVILGCTAGNRNLYAVTRDHGATWRTFQVLLAAPLGSAYGVVSRADTWMINLSGNPDGLAIIANPDADPDSVGTQFSPGAGWYVRIR